MNSNEEPEAKTVTTTDAPAAGSAVNAPEAAVPAGTADTAPTPAPADAADAADAGRVAAASPAAPDTTGVGTVRASDVTVSPDASDTGSAVNAPDAPDAVSTADAEGAEGAEGTEGTEGTAEAPDAPDAPAAARGGDSDAGGTGTGTGTGADTAATPTRRLFWSTLGVALALLLVDQISKWWAVGALADAKSIDVVGDVIRFWLVYNPGAAFSMGTGVTWIFTVFAGVAVVAIAWYAWRVRSASWAYALGLLLGGATSHFGDRLLREPAFGRGHVVDFIDYAGFFVGNVADIGIFAGAVTTVVLSFKGIDADRPNDAADKSAQ